MTDHETLCCVPGCQRAAARQAVASIGDQLCEHHLSLATPRQRLRLDVTTRRLARVEGFWENEADYDAIVASDRYLKLAHATSCAIDAAEAALNSLKLSVLAAEGGASDQAARQAGNRASG
jgi:hypothetical protein